MRSLPSFIFCLTIILALEIAILTAFWIPNFLKIKTAPAEVVINKGGASFDPKNLIWSQIAAVAPWQPRDSGEAFVFQNKIWLIGGLNGNGVVVKKENSYAIDYWKAPHFADIWNTENGLDWNLVTSSAPWGPRRSMSVAFFANKLWLMGGWSPIFGYTNDIWNSVDGIHWEKVVANADFPPAEGQSLVVFKNKIWKIGGVNYDEHKAKNDVWYSEDGFRWFKVENIPWEPRWDHSVEIFNGKLFLVGGMDLEGKIFNDVWVSDDGINWLIVTKNAPWAPRQGHVLKTYKGKLWLIGRLNDSKSGGQNDVWYSDDGINWQKTAIDPFWSGREDFFSVVFKNKIWVFGGMDRNWQWKNDIWASRFQN